MSKMAIIDAATGKIVDEQAVTRVEKGKCATVAHLQSITKQMDADFDEYEKHERAAMFFALRIGVAMVVAKEMCEHGEYQKWIQNSVRSVRLRQAYNFRSLAEAFIEQKKIERKELLLLSAPPSEKAAYAKAEQLLLDFIGGRSQAELFKEYGIMVRDPKPVGGANHLNAFLKEHYPEHPEYIGTALRALPKEVQAAWKKHLVESLNNDTAEIRRLGSQASWRMIVRQLREHGLEKKSYAYLTRAELEEVHGALIDVKKEISEALKK